MTNAPDIFRYETVQAYLRDVFEAGLKSRTRSGVRALARRAGFKSPALLSMLARGERRLTLEATEKLSKALRLTGARKRYLETLSRLDRAGSPGEELAAKETLLSLRRRTDEGSLALKQYRCLTVWYYPAIYELVGLRCFQPNGRWLSRKLGGEVTPEQAERALVEMRSVGLLVEEDGKLHQSQAALATTDGILNLAIQKYHREMLSRAIRSLELPPSEREVSGLTVRVPREKLDWVKARLRELRSELNQVLSACPDADDVYQISFACFPLTQAEEPKS